MYTELKKEACMRDWIVDHIQKSDARRMGIYDAALGISSSFQQNC